MKYSDKILDYSGPGWTPAIRCSICTGETVAGFINNTTGKFREIQLVRNDCDINAFCCEYNIRRESIKKIY